MSRLLIIGCGGVAQVAIRKCCQNSEVFTDIMIASRTFHTEPIKMDGINTKKLVVNPDEAANIRLMFEMYAQPTTSYGDITRYFAEQGILFNGKELIRPTLAQMLRNPVYVQADLDVYECFKSQGTVIVNDAADFTGMNGCYLYQGRDVKPSKKNDLKDQMLVLAPHEGIVPSDIWLTCRKKLMNNMNCLFYTSLISKKYYAL